MTLKSTVLNSGFLFLSCLYRGKLPTARLAAPEGAVRDTVLIVLDCARTDNELEMTGNSSSWILGTSLDITFNFKLCSFNSLLKKYSGPFLLFPPVNKRVSILGYCRKYPSISRSTTFCIPKSEASIFSRSALWTISQTPILCSNKKVLRCSTASAVVSYLSPKLKIRSKMGHNCPLQLP